MRQTSPAAPLLWRAGCLSLGKASALGLARFAYGLLVPAMRAELGWSFAEAGAMTTANGLGYLAGATVTAATAQRLSATATFRLGMLLIAAALAATAVSDNYFLLLASRAAAGVAGALVFITGAVIASSIATLARSAAPITIYFAGTGLGIAAAGAAFPPFLDAHPHRWTLAWVCLAASATAATAASWTAAQTNTSPAGEVRGQPRIRDQWRAAAAYVLFAGGYIAYMTFLSAYLADRRESTTLVATTWTLIGLSVLAAPLVWSRPVATWSRTLCLAVMLAVLAGSALLPLANPAQPLVMVSAVAFGLTFMSVPAAITAHLNRTTPPRDLPATLAGFTVLFAAGQAVGPWLAGALADRAGGAAALTWTAALCCTGAVVAMTYRRSIGPPIRHHEESSQDESRPGSIR